MSTKKKLWLYFPLFLGFGFIAGLLLASNLGFISKPEAQRNPETLIQLDKEIEVHELMKHISHVFEDVSSKVSVSVVSIFAEQAVKTPNSYGLPDDSLKDFFGEDFFRRFFGTPPHEETQPVRSMGSGVIVTRNGFILTNNHVIANADKLTVVTLDKKSYDAKVVGTDPPTDIAVIKINAKNLPAASLGNSDQLKPGQWVIAVGNPFHLMHTVTAGIISATGRSSVGLAAYEDFIQTDASINPGNSGGALADLDNNVIGINTAITSPSGGNIGIGFAIPINMAKQVMEELISIGKVIRGYIGFYPQDIDERIATALKIRKAEGVLVAEIEQNGPADSAGIERGDIIKEFDGKQITDSLQLRNLIAEIKPGTSIQITLMRNNQKIEVAVTLKERPNK